ncbi:MAG: hypothetical protein ACRDX8_14820, partial [Acidimicrobiales bacterium]
MSLYVVVEGHGERQALPALVGRLRSLLGLAALPYIPRDGGVSRAQLHLDRQRGQDEVAALCLQWRSRAPSAVLVTQDSDDACPKDAAPTVAGWIRQHNLRFPVAVVLFYREYETMFLAASASLAGARLVGSVPRAGLPPGAVYHGDPE